MQQILFSSVTSPLWSKGTQLAQVRHTGDAAK